MEPTSRPSRTAVTVLLVALVALNLYQLVRIAGMEDRLVTAQNRISQMNNQMQTAINNGIQELTRQLEEEASPLAESQAVLAQQLILDQESIPRIQIDLSATPKEYVPNMAVRFLLLDDKGMFSLAEGVKAEMSNRFTAQMTVPIGGIYTASAILTVNGVETTVPLEENLEPLQSYVLGVNANHSGSTSAQQGGTLRMERTVNVDAYTRSWIAEQPVQVVTARLSLRRNGVEEKSWTLQERNDSNTTYGIAKGVGGKDSWCYEVSLEETLQVQEGDQIQLLSILEDSRGLRYETMVDQFVWRGSGSSPDWKDSSDTSVYYGDTFLGYTW